MTNDEALGEIDRIIKRNELITNNLNKKISETKSPELRADLEDLKKRNEEIMKKINLAVSIIQDLNLDEK